MIAILLSFMERGKPDTPDSEILHSTRSAEAGAHLFIYYPRCAVKSGGLYRIFRASINASQAETRNQLFATKRSI
jgi:hypothetical protein